MIVTPRTGRLRTPEQARVFVESHEAMDFTGVGQ